MKLPGPSRRVRRIKISETKRMPMLAARVGGCVSLGQGVPSFATPEAVVDRVCAAMRAEPSVTKYSLQPGRTDLRAAVAGMLQREKGWAADPETEVAITCGAMEGLLMAMLTLIQNEDEVVLPEPYYPSHAEQILLAGGDPVLAPLRRADWGLDADALARVLTDKTRGLIVSTPHNPTGAVFSEEDLRAVADIAVSRNLFVICDDTYDALTYDGRRAFSLASIPELRDRLVLVGSFSKRFALTGWRVGYVAAPARLMDEMLKVHDAATICAPGPSQEAALASLEGPQNVYEDFCRELERRRDLACARLDAVIAAAGQRDASPTADAVSYVRPGGAFYIMLRLGFTDQDSQTLAERLVREARVVTIPGEAFGPGGRGCVRLSFGADEAELIEAFDRLEAWILRELG